MYEKFIILTLSVFVLVGGVLAQNKMPGRLMTAEVATKMALNVGGKMPAFTLVDSANKAVSSETLLKQGNIVLVFYRGAWCPYCSIYLRSLQKKLGEIESNGGKLVTVSVESPDKSLSVAQKNELDFTMLSDKNLDVARKFGIVYQLSPETDEKYKSMAIDLVKLNKTAFPDLPLSVTYAINKSGEIVYAFLEPVYKKRAEPNEVISELKKLKKEQFKE